MFDFARFSEECRLVEPFPSRASIVAAARRMYTWRMNRVTARGAARSLTTCLGIACLALVSSCGAKASSDSNDAASPDQIRVPSELQRPGQLRYFYAGNAAGPSMITFEAPAAPHVVSLTHPEGHYRAGITGWSPNGRTFAYQLFSEESGIEPYHFMLADVGQGFAPHAIEHPSLRERAYFVRWVGDRAIAVQTGVLHQGLDDYGWSGHYLWIDTQQERVTDLGPLARSLVDSQAFGVLPALDASTEHLWTSRLGLVYLDASCALVYLADPTRKQTLIRDCSARASWSGDGSFLVVTTDTARQIYQWVDGHLERWAFPALESSSPAATWSWAPGSPLFGLFSVTGDSRDRLITSLAVGDVRTRVLASVAELPNISYASFVTDGLFMASHPSDADQPARKYLLDTTQLPSDSTLQLVPLAAAQSASDWPVASSDSRRLYFAAHPLLEITLEAGRVGHIDTLFQEAHPVRSVLFRFLNDDNAGLLTTVEPEQIAPGGDSLSAFQRNHQYLLNLAGERAVVPLGTFDLRHRSGSSGLHTFASAPQLGGILYQGDGEHGGFVDWLGFDDITHKVRLFEAAGCCLLDLPPAIDGVVIDE